MEDQARAIARGIRELNADLVLGDYLLPAAHFGAKLAGRPYVALYHSALPFPVRNSAPFGSGLADDAPRDERWRNAEERLRRLSARYDAILTDAARALGLPKTSEAAIDRPVSDELNLLATLPEWEPGLEELHATVRMIGPCLPDAKANTSDSDDPALAAIRPGRQYVYVSLGTVFNDQSRIFDLILDGVLKTGFDAVVSAGASFERLRARESSRIHIFRKVPQIPLLKRVRLVVTHGGNNTVQETLSAGLPMIVIPFGGDQVANARRVERLGIGVALAADELSPERIADGLNRLSKTEVRKRARTLSMAAEGHDGVEAAAEAVLNLLSAGG
jgi:MGT family glycosyltransferase